MGVPSIASSPSISISGISADLFTIYETRTVLDRPTSIFGEYSISKFSGSVVGIGCDVCITVGFGGTDVCTCAPAGTVGVTVGSAGLGVAGGVAVATGTDVCTCAPAGTVGVTVDSAGLGVYVGCGVPDDGLGVTVGSAGLGVYVGCGVPDDGLDVISGNTVLAWASDVPTIGVSVD
jgi:hypothetical protein